MNSNHCFFRQCSIDGVDFVVPNQFKHTYICGSGGQAIVAKAFNNDNGQVVVIKQLNLTSWRTGKVSASMARDAYRELSILGLIKHPNIINLSHAYIPDFKNEQVYLVMPFIKNTLHERIHGKKHTNYVEGYFTDAEILKFIYKLLDGVDYLHKFGIVHRDLKPRNIGVKENGDPIIFDFGLSCLVDENLTERAGTSYYMAPEVLVQMNCFKHAVKVDIWSIGVIWIEMINKRYFVPDHDSFLDCWNKLIGMLGAPSDSFIKKMRYPTSLFYLPIPPACKPKSWAKLIPTQNFCESVQKNKKHVDAVRNVISSIFEFDPEKRPSAKDLMLKFEQNNWCKRDKTSNNLIELEKFKRNCNKAEEDETIWTDLLFETMEQCTNLLKYPLHEACFYNNPIELCRLLKTTKLKPNSKDFNNNSLLHIAVCRKNIECVQLLLDVGVDVDLHNAESKTPLYIAIRYGFVECVKLLLENGADPNLTGNLNISPLHVAVLYKNADCVQLLLDNNAHVDAINDFEETPLHVGCLSNSPNCVRVLLESGANPNLKNDKGRTPLYVASQFGNVGCVRLLLKYNADPIKFTKKDGNAEIIQLLKEYQPRVSKALATEIRNSIRSSYDLLPFQYHILI